MKYITELPPGNWRLVVYRNDVIAFCPEHPPRIINETGEIVVLASNRISVITDDDKS